MNSVKKSNQLEKSSWLDVRSGSYEIEISKKIVSLIFFLVVNKFLFLGEENINVDAVESLNHVLHIISSKM